MERRCRCYKEVTRLQHVFLFDSEIFVVPVGRALVLIGTFLVVISTIITVLVIHKKKSEEIIDDLAEKSKGDDAYDSDKGFK